MFEEGGQIRKSSKTVKACIAEGYGRRKYKQDRIKFLTYSLPSNDETLDHLENLWDTEFLIAETKYQQLHQKIEELRRMTNGFLQAIEKQHETPKKSIILASNIQYPSIRLRLRRWSAKIHRYLNMFKVFNGTVYQLKFFNIFFQCFHETFGVHGRKNNS